MVGLWDEQPFGSTPMTRAFAKYSAFPPLREISANPGLWSELMNRASRAQKIDDLSEFDRQLLLNAEREAARQQINNRPK